MTPPGGAGSPPLICFGNLTLDDIVRPDGTERKACIGGDALYGVLAARLFQPGAEMVAPVGHDLPHHVRRAIDAAGLSQDGMPGRGCPTMHTRFVYETNDRRVVSLLSDAADFETLSPAPEDVPSRYWGASACMILAMTMGAQARLVRACRAHGRAIVALDPQEEYIPGNEAALFDLVSRVDVFMPSLDEVRLLLGHAVPQDAARHFAGLGPRIVVIKMGAQGCLVHDARSGSMVHCPAYPAEPTDTTGAGDAFCSAFMASLATSSADLANAAACGAVAAGFAIGAYGADGLFAATPAQAQARLAGWDFRPAALPGSDARPTR